MGRFAQRGGYAAAHDERDEQQQHADHRAGNGKLEYQRDRLANGLIHQQERDGAEHYRMRMTR